MSDFLQTLREPRQMPLATDLRKRWVGPIVLAVAVGISYFLAARLSLLLLTKPDGVAVFWPASGVAAGLLIALGPVALLPVVAGAIGGTIAANLLGDRILLSAIVFALCNAGEAVLAASIVERYFGPDFGVGRLRNVLGLMAAAIFAAAISGIGGTVGFHHFHNATAPVLTTWQHWFVSDGLGILTVAPLLIGLARAAHDPPPRNEVIEGVLALFALVVVSAIAAFLPWAPWATVVPLTLLFPLLLWITARCRPVFAAAAVFIVALAIVGMTTFGLGLFGDGSFPNADRILVAQAGILAISLCTLVLAALFAERRQHEAVLLEGEARLQEALTAGAVMAFEWDFSTGKSQRSANAAKILGFDAQQTPPDFLDRVHPDDLAQFKALVGAVRPESPSYAVTFRFVRPDGREMWLEEVAKAEFDAAGRCVRIKGLTLDISERKRAEKHRVQLIAELDHRVKNVLARVAVVAMYTRQGSDSMDGFIHSLDARIQAMADAHELLSQSRWEGVRLTDLVRRQLAPYATGANMIVEGPDVILSSAATEAMVMVLQELVTNAVKYGSLSQPRGRVSVTWNYLPSRDTGAGLAIVWRELDGPAVAAPDRFGYGTGLIRDLIPHELGGSVDLVFAPEGVCCTMVIPALSIDGNARENLTKPASVW